MDLLFKWSNAQVKSMNFVSCHPAFDKKGWKIKKWIVKDFVQMNGLTGIS